MDNQKTNTFIFKILLQSGLPLAYNATISANNWRGEAYIPLAYFPPDVDKFNAFAMHGVGPDRQYEQLYAQKTPYMEKPDL